MSRRDRLKGLFDDTAQELAAANYEEPSSRGSAGPVRTMALTLGRMEEESRAMQEALLSGERIVELDPDLIDSSFVRDRLADQPLDTEDELVQSIAENGQKVPILVRRHPNDEDRYQIAYGHRRLQAVKLLGLKVQAIVRKLDDTDVVIAQGIENSARRNLSYIERAVFALNLELKGFERPVIMKALSTDKTELSKLISVAKAIPAEIVRSVGAAPGIGRRRWMALAQDWNGMTAARLAKLIASGSFLGEESDRRFELLVAELAKKEAKPETTEYDWKPKSGGKIAGRIKSAGNSFTIALKTGDAPDFGAYISRRLDELYEAYRAGKLQAGE
ncbi:plasmid partitioning protein RepB (plasmid) [Rhizobium leguminosarum]|uniref:plasmid partitioning protein RepB n=1 Tax=Rhizobium leguminosarum TaxID=384 RepID=UPI0010323FBB|nr:plasmid partitioning protein RepB [Rhizobium leguminosarum]QIO76128.1 plasmid partitioning protein RepB [Rhizobium leguminosarum bv. trifolii]QIO83145.1 plasmid partitioning protein RepB [Rhizobium leguminosarum bv. trifolii]TAU16602.1 plasmid partitioning protein RepB [Rhizobium leguminosarum]TAU35225.1 plasmid partitioning protein RepB [Rhizobium leguminosarum]TAU86863.1 plasmid partitioning protein RepB [Rhizobium leguminosarum]